MAPMPDEAVAVEQLTCLPASPPLQVHGLTDPVLQGVGKVLVEDGNDYYVRAVRKAQLEYRR